MGDDAFGTVTPLTAVQQPIGEQLIGAIERAVREHGTDAVVIGLAVNMDGTEGDRAKLARTFAGELAEALNLPVHLQDERLTSYAADQLMARTDLTHKQKKARRDSLAAATILQDYFRARRDATPT